MGANCCISARKDKALPIRPGVEVSANRAVRYSPSWSFRWDNRTHIEDIVENHAVFSRGNSEIVGSVFSRGNSEIVGSENKSRLDSEGDCLSYRGSPLSSLQTPNWHKSPSFGRGFVDGKGGETADASIGSGSPTEENDLVKSSIKLVLSSSKPSTPTPSCKELRSDPSSSRSFSLPSDPTSSRKARRSPGYQLSRQISDSRIPVLKSLSENTLAEGRQSLMLPACSSDLSTGGSQGGSSDGWSMRMFSELVAFSQRDRWSFDSDNLSFGHHKLAGCNSRTVHSPPIDASTCGVCSKLIKERTSWKNIELSVVAVLACGHVYHAECLENLTLETDKFDPSCPICTDGCRPSSKLKEFKTRSKRSRIAVADMNLGADSPVEPQKGSKQGGKYPKVSASSSLKNSLAGPFLKRHFSIGSRTSSCSLPGNDEGTSKKTFWAW